MSYDAKQDGKMGMIGGQAPVQVTGLANLIQIAACLQDIDAAADEYRLPVHDKNSVYRSALFSDSNFALPDAEGGPGTKLGLFWEFFTPLKALEWRTRNYYTDGACRLRTVGYTLLIPYKCTSF